MRKVYLVIAPNGHYYARSNKKLAVTTALRLATGDTSRKPKGFAGEYKRLLLMEKSANDVQMLVEGKNGRARIVKLEVNQGE